MGNPIPPADQRIYYSDWVPCLTHQNGTHEQKIGDVARPAEATLTFDHRVGDGGAAARLLHHIGRILLEKPEELE